MLFHLGYGDGGVYVYDFVEVRRHQKRTLGIYWNKDAGAISVSGGGIWWTGSSFQNASFSAQIIYHHHEAAWGIGGVISINGTANITGNDGNPYSCSTYDAP